MKKGVVPEIAADFFENGKDKRVTPGAHLHAGGLGRRTFEGTAWLLIGKFYRQILFLINAVVLGRLLSPRDFGLVGVGALAIQFLGVLTYTGFSEALVQRPRLSEREIHTAWWVILGRSSFIAAVLWFGASQIATLVHDPAVIPILRALAGIQIISSFASIGIPLLNKEMQFRRLFKLEAWGSTFDLMVAIVAAIIWRSVWALVLGSLAGAVTRVIASYFLYPIRPRFFFDLRAAKELFKFGQWLLFSACLYFLLSKGIDVLSGLFFGAAALGLYQMASRFALFPSNHLGEMFLAALFPAYSLIQDDPQRLKSAFLRVLQVSTFIIFPLSALIAAVGGPLLLLFLGAKWQGIVSLVPPLALGGAIQALLRTGPPLFMGTGRPSCQFPMDLTSSLGIVLSIYPLSKWLGLEGLAWSYPLGLSFGLPIWWRFVREQSVSTTWDLIICIVPSIGSSLLLFATIWIPSKLFSSIPLTLGSVGWLGVWVIIGVSLYVALIRLMEFALPEFQPAKSSITLFQTWRNNG